MKSRRSIPRRKIQTPPQPEVPPVVTETPQYPKRRRGADPLTKIITWFVLLDWVSIAMAFVFLDMAVPQKNAFFAGTWGKNIRVTHYPEKLQWVFILMVIGFVVSIVGILINSKRHRRKGDYYRGSLFFLCFLSLTGIVMYLVMIFLR